MQVLKNLLNIACNMQNMQNNMHDMQNMQMLFPICRICTAHFADDGPALRRAESARCSTAAALRGSESARSVLQHCAGSESAAARARSVLHWHCAFRREVNIISH